MCGDPRKDDCLISRPFTLSTSCDLLALMLSIPNSTLLSFHSEAVIIIKFNYTICRSIITCPPPASVRCRNDVSLTIGAAWPDPVPDRCHGNSSSASLFSNKINNVDCYIFQNAHERDRRSLFVHSKSL